MTPRLNINESFICRIWEGGNNYFSNLRTSEGDAVHIIEFGKRNYDGGPDYKDAKIRIGDKVFAGDVEVHRDFSGWEQHNHPKDSKYNSVILQVVLWDSKQRTIPRLRKKRDLPTVILANFLNRSIHSIWREIINDPSEKFSLPCRNMTSTADNSDLSEWLNKLSMDRLNLRARRIKERLIELGRETGMFHKTEYMRKSSLWEQVFYEYSFEALGFSKNKEPMLKLAKNIKLDKLSIIVNESKDRLKNLQAVLFGSAGLLFDIRYKDEYISSLKSQWEKYKTRFKSFALGKSDWQFFRLRPQNFPTLRIAYGSQLILKIIKENLFKNIILEFRSVNFNVKGCQNNLTRLFEPQTDEYWSYHYNFGKKSKGTYKLIGTQRINDIIVNVILPVVYLYSVVFEKTDVKNNVLQFYSSSRYKPENSIVKIIEKQVLNTNRLNINTPALEQAAIQLYNFYCTREKCAECFIGKTFYKPGFQYKIIFY